MGRNVTHAWGIASLALGIIGLIMFLAPYIGIFLSIAAVVFYGVQKKHEPTGVATGGLVTGIIGIILNGVMLVFIVGILAFMSAADADGEGTTTVVHEEGSPPSINGEQHPAQRIRSATLTINRVGENVANLQPIRVTVENVGDVQISPKFDVTVHDLQGEQVCSGSPIFDEFSTLKPGARKTGELSILGCTFSEDGAYKVTVELLDDDYTKLSEDSAQLDVVYWNRFG